MNTATRRLTANEVATMSINDLRTLIGPSADTSRWTDKEIREYAATKIWVLTSNTK